MNVDIILQSTPTSLKLLNRQKAKLYLWYLSFAYNGIYSTLGLLMKFNQTKPNQTLKSPKKDIKFIPCTLKNYKFKL